jgi:hypothetical protein
MTQTPEGKNISRAF